MKRGMVLMFLMVFAVPAQGALEKSQQTGPVESVITLEPEEPVIGDDVRLTLRVTAEKGVELIMPEFGEMLENFAIVDFTTDEQIDDQGRTVMTQRYELQPPRSGEMSIPPILVEYVDRRPGARPAPEGMDAYEHLTDRIDFEVKSVLPADAEADLHPPMGELEPIASSSAFAWRWIVPAVVGAGAGLGVWLILRSTRRKARQRSAYEVAMSRLDTLLSRPRSTSEQLDAFFVELSAIVRGYLEDRFTLRAPELTTEEFLDLLIRSPDLSRPHQDLLRDFLRRADLVKFARFVPDERDVDLSIEAARRFLMETHQSSDARGVTPEVAHA